MDDHISRCRLPLQEPRTGGPHSPVVACAKAHTADVCALQVADELDTGVLISLGGDIATAGDGPDGGWQVRVQDGDGVRSEEDHGRSHQRPVGRPLPTPPEYCSVSGCRHVCLLTCACVVKVATLLALDR